MSFWSAVRELPERPRLAVALFYAGDRTVAEVAGIVGVPEGTVRSDLSRARSFMLSRMEIRS
jgi:RNA polymerase sigma-70 factor, ECF subfamily